MCLGKWSLEQLYLGQAVQIAHVFNDIFMYSHSSIFLGMLSINFPELSDKYN